MHPDHDIIMLALPRWDGPYSSTSFSLAKEFSKTNRVFYIDNPFTIKDLFVYFNTKSLKSRLIPLLTGRKSSRQVEALPKNFFVVTPRLILPINFLPVGRFYDYCSKINDKIVFRVIAKAMKEHQIEKYIFINSFNALFGKNFPKKFKPALTLYHTVDDINHSLYVSKHGSRLEEEYIKNADLVITTSTELTKKVKKIKDHVYFLPNAADISLFKQVTSRKLPVPREIKGISKKIIGYTGNIDIRLDYKLLKNIALNHPDKILLLIGPISCDGYKEHDLDKIQNIIFTGSKNITELPAYLQQMACTIIPFKCNTLTKSIYPLKVNEYLAAGKPVISTAFSDDIKSFSEVIYLTSDESSFINYIDLAIKEDSQEKIKLRCEAAENNTWEARSKSFWKIVGTALSQTIFEGENVMIN